MSDRRAAITGLGIVSSLGTNLAKTWEGITSGRSGIGPITAWDATEFSVRFGGECTDFVTSDWVSRREERRLDRFTQLAIAAADMAIEDSGLDLDKTDRTRVGCILGSGIGGLGEIETQHGGLVDKGPRGVSPMLVPKMMVNAAPGQVSIRHGLLGPNQDFRLGG